RTRFQPQGALFDADVDQKRALLDRAVDARPQTGGGVRQRLEIHVGGEVGHSRGAQWIVVAMIAQRLKGRAQVGSRVAVVKGQGRPAALDAARQFIGYPAGAPFENRAQRRAADALRQGPFEFRQRGLASAEYELSAVIDGDGAFIPAVGLLDRLVNRNSVEE